jgi:Flp pilus assembly protein TadG
MLSWTRQRGLPGQGMVEFALVAPLFFLMLFGVMEGGWLLFHNHQVSNAAREGARFAVVNGEMSGTGLTDAMIRTHVQDRVSLSNWDNATVNLVLVDGDMEPESRIRVEVDYTHTTLVGFIFASGTIDLSSSSQMRVHY